MDLSILRSRCACFLFFTTCVFMSGCSTPHMPGDDSFGKLKQVIASQKDGHTSHHDRVRRNIKYCHKNCTGNETVFHHEISCYYDEDCYKIFSDCCPDYEQKCGPQESSEDRSSPWECIAMNPNVPSTYRLVSSLKKIVAGAWMISKCPSGWPVKQPCENAPSKFSYPIEDYLPVVGANSRTYRNKHCALCNGVENYTSWNMKFVTRAVPPKNFDLNAKLKFIESSGGWFKYVSAGSLPRRYCYGRNYIDNCSLTDGTVSNDSYKACVEGPVGIHFGKFRYLFKNLACVTCNGYEIGPKPFLLNAIEGLEFSLVFNVGEESRKRTIKTVIQVKCPSGTVYDAILKFCRKGYVITKSSTNGSLTSEYLILLWFKQPPCSTEIDAKLEEDLKSALISGFSFQNKQISGIAFHRQDEWKIDLLVATFRLVLTPPQSFILANKHKYETAQKSAAFLKLFNFTATFYLYWKEKSFTVIKVSSKQLSCYGEGMFQPNEYKIDKKNGSFVVNKTGEVFLLRDYTLVKEDDGNITLCRKLIHTDCREGAYVPLRPNEYVIFPNLSVYHNTTKKIFNFAEYLITENQGEKINFNATEKSLLSKNSKIAICLPLRNTFNKTEKKLGKLSTNYGLEVLTKIGFIVSIIFLVLLLVTYGFIPELRTVPGMNLMNLSFSMLLSNLIWLIGTSYFIATTTCEVFAILEHYLLKVSFLAMSVISYHSFLVFSRPFDGRHLNTSLRRFIKYSAFVWLTPAIFVAICVTLDKTEAFPVDYGTNCWLGTVNAKLYLFLLPLAITLLYNIYTFIKTARLLLRHDESRDILQRKEGKQNLLICIKLASLVGFPWLFAFLGVLFPDEVAFEYLFVVFVCLQGLSIGLAFLFNKNTWNLCKKRWNRHNLPRTTRPTTQTTSF